ncbi:hypothetical protein Tco_1318168 [Tanacetum coccineum]
MFSCLSPEEPEQAPPSPIYIPFVPEPVYPEFLPVDDEVFPAEEQPLPAADSPTHQSPGGDDDDDALALAEPAAVAYSADQDPYIAYRVAARMSIRTQAPTPFLSEEVAERVLALPTPPPSPLSPYSSPLPQIPSPPLPIPPPSPISPTYVEGSLGSRAAGIRQRDALPVHETEIPEMWLPLHKAGDLPQDLRARVPKVAGHDDRGVSCVGSQLHDPTMAMIANTRRELVQERYEATFRDYLRPVGLRGMGNRVSHKNAMWRLQEKFATLYERLVDDIQPVIAVLRKIVPYSPLYPVPAPVARGTVSIGPIRKCKNWRINDRWLSDKTALKDLVRHHGELQFYCQKKDGCYECDRLSGTLNTLTVKDPLSGYIEFDDLFDHTLKGVSSVLSKD